MTTGPSSDALTLQRAHLDQHRRMIIARSVAASLAGVVPVPVLDDLLTGAILGSTYRKLAHEHQVDLDDDALRNLVHGKVEPPSASKLAAATVVMRLVAKGWRKLLIAYTTTRRAQTAGRYFTLATLFDHYCARMHVGLGLDGQAALALRTIMNDAIAATPGGLSRRMIRRGIVAAARATVRAPVELADIATFGALRRLIDRRKGDDEVTEAELVDQALEQQLASESSFLARATTAIEIQLSTQGNPYLDALIDTFERLWRQRREP